MFYQTFHPEVADASFVKIVINSLFFTRLCHIEVIEGSKEVKVQVTLSNFNMKMAGYEDEVLVLVGSRLFEIVKSSLVQV